MRPREFPFLMVVMVLGLLAAPGEGRIATTTHNLSVSGPGPVKAEAEAQICIFCHTPHNASPRAPLWNRDDPGSTYIPYISSTAVAAPGQPTGASILCLSCHDGTIALGQVLSRPRPISMVGDITAIPLGPERLGTDLSDDHPISFAYTHSLTATRRELVNPAMLTGRVQLDASGQLQCTTCHDAHDNTFGKFLVVSNRSSGLCLACHSKDFWNQTIHKTSTATWNGLGPDPWPHTSWSSVADNGCENCHRPHTAGGQQRLLNYAVEEDNCYPCHNGNVAASNVQVEFSKTSRHPVDATTGTHDPTEPAVVTTRHVECSDCHNPHASKPGAGTPPGPLSGVRGVSRAGAEVSSVAFEYEICFRCHADSPNKPAPRTSRQLAQTNVRLKFNTANPSFHPVVGPGRNPDVPSLIAPLNTTSVITCSACHNSNASPATGGAGANGPHGSTFAPILVRQYVTIDNTSESSTTYALCYECHSRNSILGDESFTEHKKHIQEERTPCNVCHDPHGISLTQGNSTNNSKLINFDTSVVFRNANAQLRFESRGRFRGACYLRCHGDNHDPKIYPEP